MRVRKELWKRGHRYRLHYSLPGKPDIVFPTEKIAIFCDGCFWHGCPDCYQPPRSNKKYWHPKITKNKKRAAAQTIELENMGWTVLRYWEHEILESTESIVDHIEESLQKLVNKQ